MPNYWLRAKGIIVYDPCVGMTEDEVVKKEKKMGKYFSDAVEEGLQYIYYDVRAGKGEKGLEKSGIFLAKHKKCDTIPLLTIPGHL